MIGYSPVELAIRATLGKPPDTGTDDEATWHDHPDTITPEVAA